MIPESVSSVMVVFVVNPYSNRYFPIQRLAFPHIMASEPSALKMRMLKSALSDVSINTRIFDGVYINIIVSRSMHFCELNCSCHFVVY